MKSSKQARREARALFRTCQVNGLLDEGRIRQAVQLVVEKKPRGYLSILSELRRLVKLDQQNHQAKIESAAPLSPEAEANLKSALNRRYGGGLNFSFQANPALIGGLRIRVGSDVYDGTISGRLKQLEESMAV